MAPLNRVIIDTDPGVDDVLAMLLALAARPEEIEVMMLSITYGNVEVQSCLRNVVAIFHVIEKELEWRKARGQLEGFETMLASKPIVAVGAEHPLEDELLMADYFHGVDGLAGVHESHPHLSPADTWKSLFKSGASAQEISSPSSRFRASQTVAHTEILRLLRENPGDTITIIAVGPLTNLALAAAEDPETFLKVKEVVVMGGAIDGVYSRPFPFTPLPFTSHLSIRRSTYPRIPWTMLLVRYPVFLLRSKETLLTLRSQIVEGNITPVAEFNTYADAVATARVFALTSPNPATTMPPPPINMSKLPPYPKKLSRPLNLTLFPLDVTTPHKLQKSHVDAKLGPLIQAGSPLAEWTNAFIQRTYAKIESLTRKQADPGIELHDPLCVWYMLTRSARSWMVAPKAPEDIRVETAGQWTRGMHLVDRRNRTKAGAGSSEQVKSPGAVDITNPMEILSIEQHIDVEIIDAPGDNGGWLDVNKGNRINRIVNTPGEDAFGPYLLERIFG
ncbi:Uridine ribohydrolase 1 [Hyphodiscus hymeniophilus]|uniref:Uridine ribohydrolase 1 n=1 Tax=Hyphodiscus hymeniophilus TaxID=353542 RepID=A0A9P7AXZ4_9HELO|nr:Uridine ribohydrolase 1 [Hyphodiscus hymeniophilus]